MSTIIYLIVCPLVIAVALLILKADAARDIVVKIGAALIIAGSIYTVCKYFSTGGQYFAASSEGVGVAMTIISVLLAIVGLVLSIKYKKWLATALVLVTTPLQLWFEFTQSEDIAVNYNMYIDRLSMIMILIIGIVGSLICVYAIGYMKDDQKHQKDGKDRRPWFFFLLFVFLSAMFGIVTSNNLVWMLFFWEITTYCSFFLIGYNGLFHKKEYEDKIATRNAFRAYIMTSLGGLGFVIGIIILGKSLGTLELSTMLAYGSMGGSVVAPAIFLVFAGLTKAAQMPFDSWLLGAMVAPTPTSALLHSSTMVKAGVFLIIKLAPVLGFNLAGIMAMFVGGVTFLMTSFAAIGQTNAKKVLAYSTISNLGLICACGGVGTPEAVWAGIMLIIFHAITKCLMFLCVGTAEHQIGSRNIEDMDGLFERLPRLAGCMMIGIAGMYLAPLGMLISKWATLTAFIDSGNIILMLILCFGSAATVFYWTKWLGKLSATMAGRENIQKNVHGEETFVHITLAVLTVLVCLCFPLVSSTMVVPYLVSAFGAVDALALSANNMIIMCIMLAVIVLLFIFFFGRTNKKIVHIYMNGVNEGDDLTFVNAFQAPTAVGLRNWYMESYFGEVKMNVIGCVITSCLLVACIGAVVVIMLGGMA